jgi:signal transduction histidine kinase
LMGYFAYRNTISLQQAVNWESRTQGVLLKLDETLLSTLDIETGAQGFVLTGRDDFLAPFENGRRKSLENIEQLKKMVADNPNQAEHLLILEKQVRNVIGEMERYVNLRRTSLGLEGAIGELAKGDGKSMMDSVRAAVGQMKAEELRLLKVREENVQTTLNNNFWILVVSSIGGVVSLALANFLVLFEIRRRFRAENALLEANRGLEQRVEERTLQLEEANEGLRKSADDREQLLLNEQTARREVEVANRLRDEFMATVSHELRTPLTSILGWAKLMKTGTVNEKMFEKAIDTIIKNAETQNRLIEDLTDVNRIISGKLALEIENINAAELVASSIASIKPSADEKRLSLDFNPPEDAREKRISGDPNRLRQILLNLLTNAVKFTPEGGRIDVRLAADDGFVEVKVTDSGVGISPEFLPFVFERFHQDSANIKKSDGFGLGLAIVRHLTEMHGGTVAAESEGEGQGSTFTVKFPLKNDSAEPDKIEQE